MDSCEAVNKILNVVLSSLENSVSNTNKTLQRLLDNIEHIKLGLQINGRLY